MQTSIMVIDDFFDNAMQLREMALGLDYPKPQQATYFPGRNSATPIHVDGLGRHVSRLVGEPLQPAPGTSHGKFRVTLAGDEGQGDIHVDAQCHWSAIYYLSLPEHCQGGTDFFRHKATNMDTAPVFARDRERLGMKSFDDVVDQIIKPHSRDRSQWEHIMRVPMRFNRLVLLRPWFWHTAGPGFGQSPEDGRLIQMMFFVRSDQ
jgi:hypothetical protein